MISKRLKSLVKYVSSDDKLIDIGCDHALLDIYLVRYGYVDKMIVSDVHEAALDSGINNIKREQLSEKIETRLGNGLEVLTDQDDVNCVLISGMGTRTILDILDSDYLKNVNKLIIQSNRDYDILRKEVIKLGFYILNEEVVLDKGKIYIIIVFLRGNKDYSEIELKYGTKDMANKEIYYDYLKSKNERILKGISNSKLKLKLIKEINFLKSL